jgi:HPt (histidine-containing phosphotransfer) domain-containing protein
LAHRVHGAALVVGALELAQATLDLETQARQIPLDWTRLDRTMTAVLAAIDDYAQSSAVNDEARTSSTDD